jgi:hypothetical protein
MTWRRKRRDQRPLAACIDPGKNIPETVRLLLDRKGSAPKRQPAVDGVHVTPIIQPAMYVEHFFKKISHLCASSSKFGLSGRAMRGESQCPLGKRSRLPRCKRIRLLRQQDSL